MKLDSSNFFEKYFKNFIESRNDKIYASPLKRIGSFIIDSLIILILFGFTMKILEYSNVDMTIQKEQIITRDEGTQNEKLDIKETINEKNFVKAYYLMLGISTLYFVLFLSSKKQATIGNQIFKVMVINTKNAKVSPLDAFLRYISLVLNNSLYGIGYLLYFFTKDRAVFQDIASNTRVINLVLKK